MQQRLKFTTRMYEVILHSITTLTSRSINISIQLRTWPGHKSINVSKEWAGNTLYTCKTTSRFKVMIMFRHLPASSSNAGREIDTICEVDVLLLDVLWFHAFHPAPSCFFQLQARSHCPEIYRKNTQSNLKRSSKCSAI